VQRKLAARQRHYGAVDRVIAFDATISTFGHQVFVRSRCEQDASAISKYYWQRLQSDPSARTQLPFAAATNKEKSNSGAFQRYAYRVWLVSLHLRWPPCQALQLVVHPPGSAPTGSPWAHALVPIPAPAHIFVEKRQRRRKMGEEEEKPWSE
jgi:tRNA U34 5-methylaminomethyl-2-thiouridine-forming methyltransferase MnmC